jgi:hypothetical protein
MTLLEIKMELRRGRYAWPGGYPKFFVMGDGEALSFEAARAEWKQIVRARMWNNRRDQWWIEGVDVNWEDTALICAHTGTKIESAYCA